MQLRASGHVPTVNARDLPTEVWTEVLMHIPIGEHAAVRLVSTEFCALSESPALWRPIINAALTRPVNPKHHRYGVVHQSIRQATRALDVMPPFADAQVHAASASARRSALKYIGQGLGAADARFQPLGDRFAHSVLPHLSQAQLRTLWLTTYCAILDAVSLMVDNDWTTRPSPLFARAILLTADSAEAAAWLAIIAQGVAHVPPTRGRQARFLLTTASEHIMAIAPNEAMAAMLDAAIDMHRKISSSAAFDACYIDACVARMRPHDASYASQTLQALVEANRPRDAHAAIELAAALWVRATPPQAQVLLQTMWQLVRSSTCEIERLRARVLPALMAHAPLGQLAPVWRLALSMPPVNAGQRLNEVALFDVLARRYNVPCEGSIFNLLFGFAANMQASEHIAAWQALGALGPYALDDVQRRRCLALAYRQLAELLSLVVEGMPATTADETQAQRLSALINAFVVLAQHPAPDADACAHVFRAAWPHVHAGGWATDICLQAMQSVAQHAPSSLLDDVFEQARLALSQSQPGAAESITRARLCALSCVLPYVGDMQHAHAIALLHGMLARHNTVLGAAAAQVLVQVRHGDTERHKSVRCIEARRQLLWQHYQLTIAELQAADILLRCKELLRGRTPPTISPVGTEAPRGLLPGRKSASLWRHERRSCHEILIELTNPLDGDD